MKLLICATIFLSQFAMANDYKGLGKDSVTPEVLQKYTPPSLPAPVTTRIQKLLDIKSPGRSMVTLDGKTLFFNWKITGITHVWKLDGPMRYPVQMTGGSDQSILVGMTPDAKWLLISRDHNGEENPGLYLQSTKGGPLKVIKHQEKIQVHPMYVCNDSKTIYYAANDITPDSYAFYKYNLETDQTELIFDKPGLWSLSDMRRDEKTIIIQKATGSLTSEHFLLNLETKELTPLVGQNESEELDVAFSAKPNTYFILTNKFGEFHRLYEFKDGKYNPITPEVKKDLQNFFVDRQFKRIYVEYNDNGYIRSEVLDSKTYKKIPFVEFKDADHFYISSTTRNARFSAVGVETAREPRSSYIYDWSTKKLTKWFLPNSPEVDTSHFARAELKFFKARDGVQVPMFVRTPENCKTQSCPVIVHFHGGPESQSTPGFDTMAQLFVDAGFIFVEPNVRGSSGYGKTYINSDNGALRLNVITDIEDCAQSLKEMYKKNTVRPRVGVMGWSYGGYSSLYAMTRFAGSYDAGVALVGMSNLETFLLNTAPYRRALRISEYGDPIKDKEALKKLSPITYLDQVKDPLLIVQGVNDPRVPVGEAIQIQKKLEDKKIPSQLILFADEGHGSQKQSNQVLELGHILQFFEKHLIAK